MSHSHKLRVYFEDTDAGAIVYHANYLRFAERARTEALRALGVAHAAMLEGGGCMFVVRALNITYLRPARLDDELTVATNIQAVGGASLQLRQEIKRDNDSLAVLEVALGCVRAATSRPARIPAVVAARLQAAIG